MDLKTVKEFPITVYSISEKYSPTISKGRCKIFYKYENRNGSYITDEFAEKLIKSLPYTPVKGIYDDLDEDYTDHGKKRSLGRIYGVVPEKHNFAWETHLDEDGVERTYACADVFLYTALYEEANDIVGKSQSMEIYEPSIVGEWTMIDGKQLYKYTDGCFLGLQVLGEDVEPCFEGASFFSMVTDLKDLVRKIEEYSLDSNIQGGQSEMSKLNFKLSDAQKHDCLWTLLNTNYNEENGWVINYTITEVYDEYALAFNYEESKYERVYYTKNDENNEVSIAEIMPVYIMDITEKERNTIETLRALNGGTYDLVNDVLENAAENAVNVENFSIKITELNGDIATLTTERDGYLENYNLAQDTISALTEELETLRNFKARIEKDEKEAVIASYAEMLNEQLIASYQLNIDQYANAIELDKDLAYELKKSNPSAFTNNPQYIPRDLPTGGIEDILSKYKK